MELWKKARVPGENPCMNTESMQAPHRKLSAGTWTFSLWGKGANHCPTVQPIPNLKKLSDCLH